jgi:hypothetical protein
MEQCNCDVCHPRCVNTIHNNETACPYTMLYQVQKSYMFQLYEMPSLASQLRNTKGNYTAEATHSKVKPYS